MKLKAQIINELEEAKKKMNEMYKAAEDNAGAHDEAIFYEGMALALEWVLSSRTVENHCV